MVFSKTSYSILASSNLVITFSRAPGLILKNKSGCFSKDAEIALGSILSDSKDEKFETESDSQSQKEDEGDVVMVLQNLESSEILVEK